MTTNTPQPTTVTDFERITRRLRWLCIAAVLVTFPYDPPRVYIVYALIALFAVYNLNRYSAMLLRWRWFASPAAVLIIDNIFVGLLIAAVGNVSTPYSAFLVFMIITTAYIYGLRGVLMVAGLQAAALTIIMNYPWFPPLTLDGYRTMALIAFVLVALGLLVERMARSDRRQRDVLEKLSRENRQERLHLLALVNSITDAIFVVDRSGAIIQHNEAAAALAGKGKDLHGQEFAALLPLYPAIDAGAKPVNILRGKLGPQHRRDLHVAAERGIRYDLDIRVTPVLLEGRKSTDYIVVCQDITKEHSLDEQRQEFISVASHELRTPLAIMEAALSAALLGKGSLPEQTIELIKQAHRNTLYLGRIVKDLAMLAEAKNDNLPIELKQIIAEAILSQLVNDFDAQAKQKGLTLKTSVAPKTPSVLSTEQHIKEILQNYVNNALKYTKEGKIAVKAEPSKHGGILFSVKDSGIGISLSDQQHLFTKFFRAEDYRTRETGGSGLGLYLCMELADRLGAKVWCQSALNEGSTFYLDVPPLSPLKRDQGEVVKTQVANLIEGL